MLLRTVHSAVGALAALVLSTAAQAGTNVVTVYGTSNPYLAGQPAGTLCCDRGTPPDSAPGQSPVLASTGFLPGTVFRFSATGGFLNVPSGKPYGLDGGGQFDMEPEPFGVAGANSVPFMALVGVFLNDAVPVGIPPGRRTDLTNFTSLANLDIGQIFFIGDGRTGTGTGAIQQFFAPAGATRLFLGTADGHEWNNNSGAALVTINTNAVAPVPEPEAWASMVLGLGLAGWVARRRKAKLATA